MSNKISDSKQRVYLNLDKSLIAQIDGRAAAEGSTRTSVINDALKAYLAGQGAADAKLDAIAARLDALESNNRATASALLDAVKNQPIAIQEAPRLLPDADDWKRKSLLDRIMKR